MDFSSDAGRPDDGSRLFLHPADFVSSARFAPAIGHASQHLLER